MTFAAWLEANGALIPHQLAGLALLGVGAWLLCFHARLASTRHFAGFLWGYGAAIILSSIAPSDPAASLVLNATAGVAYFYGATAGLLCVLAFPRALHPAVHAHSATLLPAAIAVVVAVAIVATGGSVGFAYASGIGNVIAASVNAVCLVRLGREPPGTARKSLLLLATGLTLQGAYFWTLNVARAASGALPYGDLGRMVLWGNLAALVILAVGAAHLFYAARGADRERVLMARLALATIPLGAVTGVLSSYYSTVPWIWNIGGVWRLLFAALVTWGILRHQFLGVDLRVRWAISKSTIAAAFVAAFFVASEGAQILFGQGNEWVGLLAAGALVFAISPLQRAAERLAEKAVPLATARPAGVQGEASYRNAVRMAIRDRTLTRAEETHLHELARDLGIDGARAHAIIAETEAEPAGGAEL